MTVMGWWLLINLELINIKEGDSIAAVAKVVHEDDNETEDVNEETQE